jgi:hypothetical protein
MTPIDAINYTSYSQGGYTISGYKSGNTNYITIKARIALKNSSGEKIDLNALAAKTRQQLQNTYGISFTKDGENYVTNVEVETKLISSAGELQSNQLLLNVTKFQTNDYAETERVGGSRINVNSKVIGGIINGSDNNTIPHEIGHTLGLRHPNAEYENGVKNPQYVSAAEREKSTAWGYNVMAAGGTVDDSSNMNKNYTRINALQMGIILNAWVNRQVNKPINSLTGSKQIKLPQIAIDTKPPKFSVG